MMVNMSTGASAHGLCEFIDASPSPFHVCETVARRLRAAGYTELAETDRWPDRRGQFFTVRAGSLVAWNGGTEDLDRPFRVVGGHTDSPNLRVKQHPDRVVAGWQVVALEPYGGAWLNSWLDRDLGISGRLSVRDPDADGGVSHRLVLIDEPILRVPQLAIHLAEDRAALKLDPQRHVNAVWGLGDTPRSFLEYAAQWAGVPSADLLVGRPDDPRPDPVGAHRCGRRVRQRSPAGQSGDLLRRAGGVPGRRAARLPAGARAVRPRGSRLDLRPRRPVGPADHDAGAHRAAAGGDREDFLRRLTASMVASGDMAHATHPNYPERHEPGHLIRVNGGPVLKVQPNLRYATDGRTAAAFELACRQAGVPLQRYEHRADLPCGSTIGPMTSARTGIPTVDVGAAQLAMHSARELMGAADVASYAAALRAFLSPE